MATTQISWGSMKALHLIITTDNVTKALYLSLLSSLCPLSLLHAQPQHTTYSHLNLWCVFLCVSNFLLELLSWYPLLSLIHF